MSPFIDEVFNRVFDPNAGKLDPDTQGCECLTWSNIPGSTCIGPPKSRKKGRSLKW